MPLPPSTSGRTSRPEITSGFSAITSRLPFPPGAGLAGRRFPSSLCMDAGVPWRAFPAIDKRRDNSVGTVGEHRGQAPTKQFARAHRRVDGVGKQWESRLERRGEGRRREARDERGGKMTRPILPKQSDGDACRLFFLTRGRLDLDIGAEAERGEQLDDLLE